MYTLQNSNKKVSKQYRKVSAQHILAVVNLCILWLHGVWLPYTVKLMVMISFKNYIGDFTANMHKLAVWGMQLSNPTFITCQ